MELHTALQLSHSLLQNTHQHTLYLAVLSIVSHRAGAAIRSQAISAGPSILTGLGVALVLLVLTKRPIKTRTAAARECVDVIDACPIIKTRAGGKEVKEGRLMYFKGTVQTSLTLHKLNYLEKSQDKLQQRSSRCSLTASAACSLQTNLSVHSGMLFSHSMPLKPGRHSHTKLLT